MKITLLGTGTSTGVPELGCTCEVCTSRDARDARLRCSAMVTTDGGANILIDCGPDFRTQLLRNPFERIDAVLLTHHHYDHIAGLDDLRPFCRRGDIPVYSSADTQEQVRNFFPYCFAAVKYPGVPNLELRTVCKERPFTVCNEKIIPIGVMHGKLPILGYRIGALSYVTDMSSITPEELEKLRGTEVLVINALRFSKPHGTHNTVLQTLRIVNEIKPRATYFTHMMHHIGLHAKIEKCLPDGVMLGYDGLEINI
ncbi:MAG: MBL fold metallo-hydrolase [Bacteroidaceae bacterium]|nr:MBL fold metallo-hydrolase [Bacteroidaceae bacterium]